MSIATIKLLKCNGVIVKNKLKVNCDKQVSYYILNEYEKILGFYCEDCLKCKIK